MIRRAFAATLLLASAPLHAQSTTQEALQARYDRALAAGYKALFLCGAIANAERAGARRTGASVEEWELAGIQAPQAEHIASLEEDILRIQTQATATDGSVRTVGMLLHVEVPWTERMPPRIAIHFAGKGCALLPIGTSPDAVERDAQADAAYLQGAASATQPQIVQSDLAQTGFDPRYGEDTRTTAVVISRDGSLIGESYANDFGPDTPQRTWSVAKSIAATLVGATAQRGEADVNASAGLGLDAADPRRAITIDHLLRMASGRYSDMPGNRTDPLYWGGSTVEETALDWPLVHEPGTVYRYANNDTLAAVEAIEGTFADHPPAAFFRKLGMDDTVAETDWRGSYVLSSQVWSTARDLAKLGQLYLDDGVLPNGERILPEGWTRYISSPAGPQPDGAFGYGAGFWLLDKSEGVPPDTYAMMGNRGQYVVIVPSRDVVIVRRGEDPVGARFDIAAFTRDVLASLD